jgi:hypothetical protein
VFSAGLVRVVGLDTVWCRGSAVERDDAEIALHAERHAGRVARIGEDRHDVVADLARRHRRAETGEEGFEADALTPRVSLTRFAPELGLADDLLGDDRLKTDAEIELLGYAVRVLRSYQTAASR